MQLLISASRVPSCVHITYIYILVKVPLALRVHYGNITQGRGREANIARGEAAIFASRPRPRAIFPVVHERKRYFNWFIATYTEQYFRYYIFQGKIVRYTVRRFHLVWLHTINVHIRTCSLLIKVASDWFT